MAHAGRIQHHDLAVDHRVPAGQRRERRPEIPVAMRPVEPAPGDQPRRPALDMRHRPVAVELDLVQPVVALRRRVDRARELRLHALRQRRPHRPRQRPRPQPHRPRTRRLRYHQLLDAPAALHALRPCHQDVRLRIRRLVALLEEQPRRLLLAGLRLQPRQHPAAVELLARQPELERPAIEIGLRIAHRRPGAGIPDDHRPAAVLALRDHPLEVDVFQRMVLGLHRQPLLLRVERRSLRHRPALQHPAEFQPQVVMIRARLMLVHDKPIAAPARPPARGLPGP